MNRLILLSILSFIFFSSCVTSTKYNELSDASKAYQKELNALKKTKGKMLSMTDDLKDKENNLAAAKRDVATLQQINNGLEISNQDLNRRYNDLLEQNKALLSSTSDESIRLRTQSTSVQTELDQQYRANQRLQREIDRMKQEVELVRSADKQRVEEYEALGNKYTAQQKKTYEVQMLLDSKEAQLDALRSRMNKALVGFSDEDMQISESNGKLYLSMSSDLMFTQNSNELDRKGKNVLFQIANAIGRSDDFEIIVEGHTDADVEAQHTWELSTQRAINVVKQLIEVGVSPNRIIASGRGYHLPVADNTSELGKSKNRRTEIILAPRLDQLYDIINN